MVLSQLPIISCSARTRERPKGTSQGLSFYQLRTGVGDGMGCSTVSTFGANFPDLKNQILELYEGNNYLLPLFTKTLPLLWHTIIQSLCL